MTTMKKITFILACLICTLCFGVLAGCHGKEANTGQEDTANVADTAYANSIDSATMAKITQCNDPINELRTRVEKAESQLGSLNNRLVYIMAMSAVGVVALIIAVFLLLKRVKNRDLRSLDCEIKKLKERVPYLESSSKENNIGRKKIIVGRKAM